MGLFSGIKNVVTGGAKLATAPLRGAANAVGTGLESGGKVLQKVSKGDIKGAGGELVNGAKKQVSNVGGYFSDNLNSVKQVAGGFGEFGKGGLDLIGKPVKTGVRIATAPARAVLGVAGAGLVTGGQVLSKASEGDFSGAGGVLKDRALGVANDIGNAGQSIYNTGSGIANGIGNAGQSIYNTGSGLVGGGINVLEGGANWVGNGISGAATSYVDGVKQDYNSFKNGLGVVGGGVQSGFNAFGGAVSDGANAVGNAASATGGYVGSQLEGAGVALQEASQ